MTARIKMPPEMARYDYFLSHHQADSGPEASLLAETLRNQGYRVFLDVDTHLAGDITQITRTALEDSRAVVVMIGRGFAERVRTDRDWVSMELLLAQKLNKKIVPVLADRAHLDGLPHHLQFLTSLRSIRFDRARVYAIADELREAFGFKARLTQGPSTLIQVLLVVLAISLGLSLYRSIRLEAELRAEENLRRKAEQEQRELQQQIDSLREEYMNYLRSNKNQQDRGGLSKR